jgi:hypothetical protein
VSDHIDVKLRVKCAIYWEFFLGDHRVGTVRLVEERNDDQLGVQFEEIASIDDTLADLRPIGHISILQNC